MRAGMERDFSWAASARRYGALYETLVAHPEISPRMRAHP